MIFYNNELTVDEVESGSTWEMWSLNSHPFIYLIIKLFLPTLAILAPFDHTMSI